MLREVSNGPLLEFESSIPCPDRVGLISSVI